MPNNNVLFVTIDKFDPNLVLVNITKSKPYTFIENRTLQLVLAKPNDLAIDEPIQIEEPEPLLVEYENLQPVGFEHGNIITNVLVHYYHDVPIKFNNVHVHNDQNDTFNEKVINVYILEVYYLKGHVYS